MTPFEAITPGVVTRAPPTKTLPPVTRIATDFPLRVFRRGELDDAGRRHLALNAVVQQDGAQLRLVFPSDASVAFGTLANAAGVTCGVR